MALLDRLFRRRPTDDHAEVRPLWFATVAAARDPLWYRELGVADTVEGRFDMITLVLALVLLRLEREPDQAERSVRLTELFVEDMDGQLRESGVGDVVVGKQIGRLVSVLGGRLGALREARASRERAQLEAALARNVTMLEGRDTAALAGRVLAFDAKVAALDSRALLAGAITL